MELMTREAAADPRVLALGAGLPASEWMPRETLTQAFADLMADPEQGNQALQYGWPEGHEGLRRFIADRLRGRGVSLRTDEVIITSGAQQALMVAAMTLRRVQAARQMQVDHETYPSALDLFRDRGFELTAAESPLAYALPAMSLPRGQRMGAAQRQRLLERQDVIIIEDDAYAELPFDGNVPRPLVADARNRVWHVGTFSKVLCPGLRVGWLIPPAEHAREALNVKQEIDLHTSGLSQSLTLAFLQRESLDQRLRGLRAFYLERAQALAAAFTSHFPGWSMTPPEGGFSLWVVPDEDKDEAKLMALALEEGVSFDPGSMFRFDGSATPLALRMCFSCNSPSELHEGVARLSKAWHRLPAQGARANRSAVQP
jgi:2-aminoadipate transaminase